VGFDGSALRSPAAGVRRYAIELLRAIVALGAPVEMVALGGEASLVPDGIAHVPAPWHPATNVGWTQIGLPRAAARANVHLVHAPAYTAPLMCRRPVVLTIHDVSYARHPEWYPYRRDRLRRAFYRLSAHAASVVVTDSAFSAAEIEAAYTVPRERIAVVPLGVTPAFGEPSVSGAQEPRLEHGPYVLHVGDLHARRNLGVALSAVLTVRRAAHGSDPCAALALVAAGVDRGTGDELARMAAAAGAPDAFVPLGRVEEARLRALYRGAVALVYPSRYEGFGLPVLEAMASGTPVVAARAASMPEVLGGAGVLVSPDDADAWAQALRHLLDDAPWRAQLAAQGVARAAELTWARTARLTVEVYQRVAHA